MTGWAFCGSFCTLKKAADALEKYSAEQNILPIISYSVKNTVTRFGDPEEFIGRIESICGRKCVSTIAEAEPIGPQGLLDLLIIAPCTGNTLAKLACGITDTPVTMAAKAHLRNNRPLVIALATNDALSANFGNIARLSERKNIFFVPFSQDDPISKPSSLVSDLGLIGKTAALAKAGVQLEPMLLKA